MDFPDLVLSRILFYLNLDVTDQFRLRLVCKRWKEFIEFQIGSKRSLCVYDENSYYVSALDSYPYRQRWPSNGELISHSDVLTQTLFEKRLGHFWGIQRLALHRTRKETFGGQEVLPKLLELLSSGLVELSLFLTDLLMEDGPVKLDRLSFPGLKTLRIKEQFSEPLQIIAPELEKLIIEHCSEYDTPFESNPPIVLSHPEKLKHLECQMVDRLTAKYFPNLEHLTVRCVDEEPFDLSDYRQLKRLDLWISTYLSEPEPVFENFLQQKQELGMDELTITHFGFKKCFDIEADFSKWQRAGNYPEFANVLYLSPLAAKIIENLPGFTDAYLDQRFGIYLGDTNLDRLSLLDSLVDFFCRTNFVELRVEGLSSEQSDQHFDQIIRFLKGVQGLETLRLNKCKFAQKFYEQLKSVPFLSELDIQKCSEIERYDFIEHINGLVSFELYHENSLPFEPFFSAFRKSKLKYLLIQTPNLSFALKRKHKSCLFNLKGEVEKEFERPYELYMFLQHREDKFDKN